MRDRGRFEVQQHGKFLHTVGLFGKQPYDLEPVCVCKSFEKVDQFFAHVISPLGFTDVRVEVVTALTDRLKFFQTDLLEQRQFVLEIEVRMILDLHHFQ